MQVITSRSLIEKAIPYTRVTNKIHDLRWGIQSSDVDNEGKEYCTYQLCRYVGNLDQYKFVSEVMPIMSIEANLSEMNEILIQLDAEEDYRFQILKDYLVKKVNNYDKSKEVNSFSISGYETWLDKATRVGLKLRFESELAQGMTDTILWQDGMQFPLLLADAINLLYAIEIYASACYDNTQMHLSEVSKLTTIEELLAYDYKVGYPEKLKLYERID